MHSSPNVISLQQQPRDACMLYHIYLSLPNAFSARTSCKFYSLFFPLHISASLFFPSIFFPSFFFINYRRSHFSFGSLCACLFWMEYTGKVQSPQLFSQLFFPTKPVNLSFFKTWKSLSMIIYFNDSIFRSTNKSYFLFFLIPTPYSIWLQNLWSREKWIPLLINQPSLFISSSLELVLKVVVWCIHKYL